MRNHTTTATEDLLDKAQTAQRLNISPRTLDNRIKAGAIPYVKLGKLIRFVPADVARFIESQRIG
jgi:excisionase family DNA binding protein